MARAMTVRPAWERHLQTALMALAVAGIAWVGSSLLALLTSVARFEVQLASFEAASTKQAIAMEQLATNSATKSEHDRDMTRITGRLEDHEQRLRGVESRRP